MTQTTLRPPQAKSYPHLLGITSGCAQETLWDAGNQPRSDACEANVLPLRYCFSPQHMYLMFQISVTGPDGQCPGKGLFRMRLAAPRPLAAEQRRGAAGTQSLHLSNTPSTGGFLDCSSRAWQEPTHAQDTRTLKIIKKVQSDRTHL